MLNIAVISGSGRPQSQSTKVAHYLLQRSQTLNLANQDSSIIDLGEQPLPLWPAPDSDNLWPVFAEKLTQADALIVVVPEWHGMAAPAIKNFFLYATQHEIGHKPTLLVGVSAGIGGAYPISELRASGYKNSRIGYIPEHLIVRSVETVLNEPEASSDNDVRIRKRADYALNVLALYGQALSPIRAQLLSSEPDFATGM